MKLNFLQKLAVVSLFVVSAVFSMELRPSVQWYAPADVTVAKEKKNVKSERDFSTDFVLQGGVELLFAGEYNPMRFGFGLGVRSSLKDGSREATPWTLPIWATFSFGRIDKDSFFSPYFSFKGGTLAPLSGVGAWWELPLNWLVGAGVGVIISRGVGLEVNCEYSSMLKSYEDDDLYIRVNSPRFGILLSIGFELKYEKIYKERLQ